MVQESTEERLERERIERFIAHLERSARIKSVDFEKYEYLTRCYDLSYFSTTSSDGTRFLNEMAGNGWELVQMLSVPVTERGAQLSSQCLLAIYRRRLRREVS
jgi:hypothetical protein